MTRKARKVLLVLCDKIRCDKAIVFDETVLHFSLTSRPDTCTTSVRRVFHTAPDDHTWLQTTVRMPDNSAPLSGGTDRIGSGRPPSANSPRSPRPRSARGRKEVGVIGQASWLSSVINLVNTIVGAGVLAMPLALSRMGMLLGTLIILWAGLTAGFGLYLQTRCARYLDRGSASFFALSQITYPNAAVIFDAAISIKCFGVGVSYLIIIGDLMPGVVKGFSEDAGGVAFLVNRQFWVTGFM